MEAAQALRELMQLSSQITSAVVLESNGSVLAASSTDPAAVDALTASTLELVAAASELGSEAREVTRVEVELDEGAFFVVREAGRTVGAVTGPNPTSGLVVYDLRTCAQTIDVPEAKKRRATRKKESTE